MANFFLVTWQLLAKFFSWNWPNKVRNWPNFSLVHRYMTIFFSFFSWNLPIFSKIGRFFSEIHTVGIRQVLAKFSPKIGKFFRNWLNNFAWPGLDEEGGGEEGLGEGCRTPPPTPQHYLPSLILPLPNHPPAQPSPGKLIQPISEKLTKFWGKFGQYLLYTMYFWKNSANFW